MKVLLIGCGYWGKNWYKTIKNSQYELIGVVEPNLSFEIDVPHYKSLLDVPIDSFTHVIIATPAETHLTIVKELEKSIPQKNILVEKPCGISKNEALMMPDVFPGFVYLYDPMYELFKNNIYKVGDVISYHSCRASMGPRIRTDVSIIEDYLIHDLYIYADLFGTDCIEILNLNLRNDIFSKSIKAHEVNLLMKHYGTTFIHMFSSWWYPVKKREIIVIGKEGSLIWNDSLIYNPSQYVKYDGYDKFGNDGYKLELNENIYLNLVESEKTSLMAELDRFSQCEFNPKLVNDIWSLIDTIKRDD